MAQNGHGGLEHGVTEWLPAKHARISHGDKQTTKGQFAFGTQQRRPHGMNSLSPAEMNSPLMFQGQLGSGDRPQRARACGGPGMQAIFLGSNKRSCGTGVFLPRTQGADSQFSRKPAFSPVLLPARVVQALNLNVHQLGQLIKPQPDQHKTMVKKMEEKLENKENAEEEDGLAPEYFFLPEEWTY